jgi:Toastrack DUF4097
MRKEFPAAVFAAAAVLLSAACIMVMDPETDSSWQPRGEFRKTFDLQPGGTVSVENAAGNVEITGWEKAAVEVVAQGTDGEGAKKRKVRAYGFWELKPDVEVKRSDGGLVIRTRPSDGPGEGEPAAVDYMIRVPNSVLLRGVRIGDGNLTVADVFGRLEASLENGDLHVVNFSGSIDASVGAGAIDVEALDLRSDDAISLSSEEGDIVLRLEPGTSADLDAEAPRAEVRSDLDPGVKTPAPRVKGRMGDGGADIRLSAANGRIEILAVKDAPGAASGPITPRRGSHGRSQP